MPEKEYIEHKARYIDINKVTIPTGFFNQDLNVPKLLDWLNSQPTADVTEVTRGEWVKPSPSSQECCNQCGKTPKMVFGLLPDYCPWCGAKMDSDSNIVESCAKVMLRLCGTEYKYCDGICKNCNEPEYHATNSIQRDVTNG